MFGAASNMVDFAPEAYAHAPIVVNATNVNETTADIHWAHPNPMNGTYLPVDIDRTPQGGSATTILNNSTGGFTGAAYSCDSAKTCFFRDTGLSQGTVYSYTVCHGDTRETGCAAGAINTTNAAAADAIWVVSKFTAPGNFTVTPNDTSADLAWDHWYTGNMTALDGYQVQYKSITAGDTSWSTATSNSNSTSQSYTITGLSQTTEYMFRVFGMSDSSHHLQTSQNGTGTNGTLNASQADWNLQGSCGCTFTTLGQPDEVKASAPIATAVTSSGASITGGDLTVSLFEDRGWDRILNVALYTNISGSQTIEDSDTYIIWNYFDPVYVSDPHNYFNDVSITTTQTGVRTMDISYDITWNKSLTKADAILETADFQSNKEIVTIADAWTSFPVTQVSYETPEETPATNTPETIMTLFDGGVMNHLLLGNNIDYAILSDKQYFVSDEVIDVSQDETVVVQDEGGVKQLFEDITLTKDDVKVAHNYLNTLVISGTVHTEFHQVGESVIFSVTDPDGYVSEITAVTTSDRIFKVPIITEEFKSGTYQFQPSHNGILAEPILIIFD